jgi:dihydroorotate dehydrogenase (NAD+) catalytic subunit
MDENRLAVDLAPSNPRELRLTNPVIAASGCFGYGLEYSQIIDVQRLGAFVSKGITPRPRQGNPMPRIVETPSGMLNAIGLQNPGIHGFIKKYPSVWEDWQVPAIVNISAESVEDYAMMASLLDEISGVAAIEVNISCPNIARGGYCFGWDPDMSADVTRAVRRATTLPVMVKLSPGATDVVSIAQAVEEAGADSISLINTLVGMSVDARTRQPVLANITGGLSGPAIKPIALRMVYQVAAAVRVPVIGMGGIAGLADALEFFMAGASAIQVGTAIFVQPGMLIRLIEDLDAWLHDQGVSSISEIVGVAHPQRAGQHQRDLAPETAVAAG